MESNKIFIEEDGKEKEYRVILTMEDVDGKNFVVYTKDEKKSDDTLCYAALYEEVGKKYKVKSIKDDKDWEFIRDVLNSIQGSKE